VNRANVAGRGTSCQVTSKAPKVHLYTRRREPQAEQLGSGELVEDLLRRVGLIVRLEQGSQLLGATPGVVDRMLAMQRQCLFSPLACLVELAQLGVGSG
jgi:hypothetical protein